MKKTFILLILSISFFACQKGYDWKCEGNCYNGVGIKKWNDGGIDSGTWVNGELTGKAYQYFGKSSAYAGDTFRGEISSCGYHGFGIYYDSSEDARYIGNFVNGHPEGHGKFLLGPYSYYPNGYSIGEFKNGRENGYAVKYFGDPGDCRDHKYEGNWKNGKKNGYGKYFDPENGTRIGFWDNDLAEGDGIFIFPNGDTLQCTWEKDYCREVDFILHGETPSTFVSLLDELCKKSDESWRKFINEMQDELFAYDQNNNYQFDFQLLKI